MENIEYSGINLVNVTKIKYNKNIDSFYKSGLSNLFNHHFPVIIKQLFFIR